VIGHSRRPCAEATSNASVIGIEVFEGHTHGRGARRVVNGRANVDGEFYVQTTAATAIYDALANAMEEEAGMTSTGTGTARAADMLWAGHARRDTRAGHARWEGNRRTAAAEGNSDTPGHTAQGHRQGLQPQHCSADLNVADGAD